MKRTFILGLILLSSPFLYAQEAMVLDDAIMDSVVFFSSKIQSGMTIAVTHFEAETKELSDFIIEELLVAFANTGNVIIVERSRMEILESELNFNMTGSVSDETAQRIGRMTGAQILFSGSISQYRDMYRIRIQAVVVETAEIIGIRTINVMYDTVLIGLLKKINPIDAWKYQWLYIGVNFGYSTMLDKPENRNYPSGIPPLGFDLYAMVQPFDFFGIAFNLGASAYLGANVSLLPTMTLRPSRFEIDIFGGIGYNFIGWGGAPIVTIGARGGYHLGSGVIFAETRSITLISGNNTTSVLNLTLGYQTGFILRKK